MTEPLDIIWSSFDAAESSFTPECVGAWPAGAFETLRDAGLVREGAPAAFVVCPACQDGHVEEVRPQAGRNGAVRYFIGCPEGLRVEIEAELRRTWTVDHDAVADAVAKAISPSGRCVGVLPDRLWRLRRVKHGGASRDMLLARGLDWGDGAEICRMISSSCRPIVFTPTPTSGNVWPDLPPPLIALSSVAKLTGGVVVLDAADVAAEVDEVDRRRHAIRPIALTPKQQDALFREQARAVLRSHLSHEEIIATYLRHGTVRATGLALGISKDRVQRALNARGGARAIREQESSASIVRSVASRSRDKKKKK